MSNGDGRNLSVQTPRAPSVVTLGPLPTIDISFLPEAQRNALMEDYARGTIDIAKRAHELHVDVGVLKNTLDTLATTTREVSESGNAVTVSHTPDPGPVGSNVTYQIAGKASSPAGQAGVGSRRCDCRHL